MNILLVNHYASYPELGMEFRPYYLAKEWVKQGHNVRIIAGSYSHLRKKDPERDFETKDGVEYSWVKVNQYKGNGVGRMLSILLFVFKLYFCSKKYLQDFVPDVVIASSTYPFDIYPSRKIAKKYKAKLVFEIHDLWPLSPILIGGYSEKHPFIVLVQKAEDYCYKYSDKIISLLWNAKEHIENRGFKDFQYACVPNGYVKEEWVENDVQLPESHVALFEQLRAEGKIIVGYAGGHTQSTALETLIDAAKVLETISRDVAVVLVGRGVEKDKLKEKSRAMGLKNIYFLDIVDKSMVASLIRKFDIAYMGGVHSQLHKYGTSFNKMTDYMLAKKPIIAAVDEPNSLIDRVGCGVMIEAENYELLAQTIKKLSENTEDELIEIGSRGYKYATENLEYGVLAAKFIEEMENII